MVFFYDQEFIFCICEWFGYSTEAFVVYCVHNFYTFFGVCFILNKGNMFYWNRIQAWQLKKVFLYLFLILCVCVCFFSFSFCVCVCFVSISFSMCVCFVSFSVCVWVSHSVLNLSDLRMYTLSANGHTHTHTHTHAHSYTHTHTRTHTHIATHTHTHT